MLNDGAGPDDGSGPAGAGAWGVGLGGRPLGGPAVGAGVTPGAGGPGSGPERGDPTAGAPTPRRLLDRLTEGVAGGASLPPAESGPPEPAEPGAPRRSLARLGLVVAAVVAVAIATPAGTVIAAVAVIAAVIMLHELGHFTAAKLSGMKVTEYFLGFGPKLWSVRKGETEYGVKAIPAGGYVRIVGMNNLEQVDPADEPRTYRQQSFPRRFAVAVAGSTVHFILALIALWTLFSFVGQSQPAPSVGVLAHIQGGPTAAQQAGFQVGDRILSWDGIAAHDNWTALHDYIANHLGVPVHFVVERDGHQLSLTATPMDRATLKDDSGVPLTNPTGPAHVGFLGIQPGTERHVWGPLPAVPHAAASFWSDGVVGTFKSLGSIFSPKGLSGIGKQVAATPGSTPVADAGNRPVSVVGIVEIANQVHQWELWLELFISANIFVGIINLFPVLPFDGGHVLIAVYERLRSRRGRRYVADVGKMMPYAFAVVALLGVLFVSSLYLDIAHPISFH